MDPRSLSALILAGGQSSRMGRDKALIEINGVPMLTRVCEAALQCAEPVYVLTPWVERYRAIAPHPCQWLQESRSLDGPGPGPLVAFAQALAHLDTDWVLLLACDLPRINGAVLQRWSQQLTTATQATAVLPLGKKGWEPLCGFYRRDCQGRLQAAIANGTHSFQQWLAQEPVQALPVDDPTVLWNCNTPEDLSPLRR
jgi:molybdenum cofactor guanylyltransferase